MKKAYANEDQASSYEEENAKARVAIDNEAYKFEKHLPVITEKKLEESYDYNKVKADNALKSTFNYLFKYYKPSGSCAKNYLFERFPILEWTTSYNFKECFVKDLIAGLTIGIVHIPQGMAFSLMAGLPAINGLYVSFFAIVMYLLLGTSKHLSHGTYAIVSLMIFSAIEKYDGILFPSHKDAGAHHGPAETTTLSMGGLEDHAVTEHSAHMSYDLDSMMGHARSAAAAGGSSPGFVSNDPVQAKIMIAMTLAIICGIVQMIFALLHIGFVIKYLSDAVVDGFISAAAFHVVVSQISTLLGIKLEEMDTPFKMIGEFIQIAKNLPNTNIITLIISVISIIFLYVVKTYVNEKFKAKLPIPVPVELIVVVAGTVISYFAKFGSKGVKIIGALPLGIPAPILPPSKLFGVLMGDGIAIAIVSFAINISIAKMFANKHKYTIKPNQELFAYGAVNIVAGVFRGFPACAGLSRCAILESVGGKTQACGVYASILVLLVILFLGPLFRTLPNACLAAIIVVALKHMVMDAAEFPHVWRRSKLEGLAWIVTYATVLILDVDIGLYVGICFALLLIIFRSQRARSSVIGNIPNTNIYESIETFPEAREFDGVKIIRYEESLYYANVDNFKYKVMKQAGVNPTEVTDRLKAITKKYEKLESKKNKKSKKGAENPAFEGDHNGEQAPTAESEKAEVLSSLPAKFIILDCSCFNYIDTQGVNGVYQLFEAYKEIGVSVYLSYCKPTVIKSFKKLSMQEKLDFDFIFATTHDAIRKIAGFYSSASVNTISEQQQQAIQEKEQPQQVQIDIQIEPEPAGRFEKSEVEYITYPHLTYKNRENTYDSVNIIF